MADVTAGGRVLDSRQAKIQLRRKELEIYSLKGRIQQVECDIWDKEADIDRARDQIISIEESIVEKELQLVAQTAAMKEQQNG